MHSAIAARPFVEAMAQRAIVKATEAAARRVPCATEFEYELTRPNGDARVYVAKSRSRPISVCGLVSRTKVLISIALPACTISDLA